MKILIIEDDIRLRENILQILSFYNYKAYSAVDGLDGYNQTLSLKPDLIICDLIMPKMTGFEFIASLKNSELSQTPVILLTGKKDFDEKEKLALTTASAYLKKPFLLADLILLIKKYSNNS